MVGFTPVTVKRVTKKVAAKPTMAAPSEVLSGARLRRTLKARLAQAADPAQARGMQAYMKSEMPFMGVKADAMRAVCKDVFAGVRLTGPEDLCREALGVWRGAVFREERYAAIELTGLRTARPFQTLETLPMYEELISTGAWWDLVDPVAIHRLGPLLSRYPEEMTLAMRAWSASDDMWKRRASIICQNARKADTDRALLYGCIEPSIGSREFFLRKAIGWALREHAKIDGAEVLRYVREKRELLSPLSKREALKAQLASGELEAIP